MNIVITGVSRGLGFNIARQFLKEKEHRVYGLTRNEDGLKKLSALPDGGTRFIGIPCDITDEKSIDVAINKIRRDTSGIEILINNAGLLINKPFGDLTLIDWKRIYDVNVFGVVRVIRGMIPLLKSGNISPDEKIRSHVVNISSMGGVQGSQKYKGLSAYSSSKGALINLTECLSEEFRGMGIHVNCIALGSVETEMFSSAFPGLKASASADEMAVWVKGFAMKGQTLFNGKIIPVSVSNP